MEHLGLTTASTRSDSSRKLPPRCDLSSTFSIIFPVQVAVWGYWKCSSSEFSVDRVHHSYRFSFGGGSPYPTPFLGGWNVETFPAWFEAPKDTHFTPAPETGFLRPGWVYTDIAPRIRGETLKPPNGKKRWEQSIFYGNNPWQILANHLAKHIFGGLILVLRVFGMGMSSKHEPFLLAKSLW